MLRPRGGFSSYVGYSALTLILMYVLFLYNATKNGLNTCETKQQKLKDDKQELLSHLSVSQEYNTRMKVTLADVKDAQEKCTTARKEAEIEREKCMRQSNEVKIQLRNKESELSTSELEANDLRTQLQDKKEDCEQVEQKSLLEFQNLKRERDQIENNLQTQLAKKTAEIERLQEELTSLKDEQQHQAAEKQKQLVAQQQQSVNSAQQQVNNVQPQVNNVQPQVNNVQPQVNNVQPQVSNVQPQVNNVHPQVNNVQPQVNNARQQVNNVQQGYNGQLQGNNAQQQDVNNGQQQPIQNNALPADTYKNSQGLANNNQPIQGNAQAAVAQDNNVALLEHLPFVGNNKKNTVKPDVNNAQATAVLAANVQNVVAAGDKGRQGVAAFNEPTKNTLLASILKKSDDIMKEGAAVVGNHVDSKQVEDDREVDVQDENNIPGRYKALGEDDAEMADGALRADSPLTTSIIHILTNDTDAVVDTKVVDKYPEQPLGLQGPLDDLRNDLNGEDNNDE